LSLDNDNQGFMNYAVNQPKYYDFFKTYPNYVLFGEWLVKHSIGYYHPEAYRKNYIYDVYDGEKYLGYNEYTDILNAYDIDYIPCKTVIKNGTKEILLDELNTTYFLLPDNKTGQAEGIVLKAYDFINKYGRNCFAKIVTNEFKTIASKKQPTNKVFKDYIEQRIIEEYLTKSFVEKTYYKIKNTEGWNSKMIPRLFGICWYDFINEEIWNIIKKHKNPLINFKRLNQLMIIKIKELMPELF